MKIFRDKTHSLITFNYRHQGKSQLAITIMAMFSFTKKNEFLNFSDFWNVVKKNFNSNQGEFIDLYMPKKRAEYFVKGSCYSYNSTTSDSIVKITLGQMQKKIAVFGDRLWSETSSQYRLSRPSYFSRIPLTLNNAYGGKEHEINPDGQGFTTKTTYPEVKVPNIELPDQLLREPTETPYPAMLLPHSPTCKHQVKLLGTFNNDWLVNESPYYPADIDWHYFNRAEMDQQSDRFFVGDEEFSCTNMHPDKPLIKSQLPGMRVRCFFKRLGTQEGINELTLNLDTIWLLPDEEKGVLIWHGEIATQDITGQDIDYIYSVNELLHEIPKEKAFYEHLRTNTKDRVENKRPKKERVKTPERAENKPGIGINLEKVINDLEQPFLTYKNAAQALAQRQFKGTTPEETIAELEQFYKNLNKELPEFNNSLPYSAIPFPETPNTPQSIPPTNVQQFDFLKDDIMNSANSEEEKSVALKQYEQLKQKLEQLDQDSRKALFRKNNVEHSKFSREDILEGYQQKKEFNSENLAGIDLSDLDLSGISLSGCNLSQCNLTRTRLNYADLSETTLIHTNLYETQLENANLSKAMIRDSSLIKTNFKECLAPYILLDTCVGTDCNFSNMNFSYSQIKNCQLSKSLFVSIKANFSTITDSTFEFCNFSEAQLQFVSITQGGWINNNVTKTNFTNSTFDSTQLSNVRGDNLVAPHLSLNKCTIDHLVLNESNLDRLSCKGATLSESTFSNCFIHAFNLMNATMSECNFIKSVVTKLRGNNDTKLSATLFEYCNLGNLAILGGHYTQITIRHCELDSTQFMRCSWSKSVFSQCDAKKLRFVNCKVDSCLFQDINFFQGVFYATPFVNSEFNHCNLYSIPFTNCSKENVKIIDCLTKESSINEEQSS